MIELSKSLTTEQQYEKRVEQLIKSYEFETNNKFSSDYFQFLIWLDLKAESLAPSSRRLYRAAVSHYFEKLNILILELNSKFMQVPISKKQIRRKFGKRTSALKNKNIDEDTWEALQKELIKSTSLYAPLTLNLLRASMLFGLRPIEWAKAELHYKSESLYVLKVKNSKSTNSRSFATYRHITFEATAESLASKDFRLGLHSADWLIHFFSSLKDRTDDALYRDTVESELVKARQYLNQLFRKNKRLKHVPINKRISLYSARHQFAADAKRNGLSAIEIAALMGHGSIETNCKFYGRKINGKQGFFVKATTEDVLKISSKTSQQSFVPNSN